MNVAIHQPECFPWLGFFHKMSLADTFVLLDTVQFEKNNFQNRNKFLIAGEAQWLSIPVEKHSLNTLVQNIKINWTDEKLTKKHLMSIEQSYKKCEFFENVFPFLQELYHKKHKYLSKIYPSLLESIECKYNCNKNDLLNHLHTIFIPIAELRIFGKFAI